MSSLTCSYHLGHQLHQHHYLHFSLSKNDFLFLKSAVCFSILKNKQRTFFPLYLTEIEITPNLTMTSSQKKKKKILHRNHIWPKKPVQFLELGDSQWFGSLHPWIFLQEHG